MKQDPWQEFLNSCNDPDAMRSALTKAFRRAVRLHPRRGQLSHAWQDIVQIPWAPNGYFHADHENPGQFLDYHTGTIYPQDAASQLPPALLAPQAGEIILDACAAPGSKTTAAGLALDDSGCVIAVDKNASRRKVIRETAARQGLINVAVTPLSLQELSETSLQVDAAMVDAPCSGHEKRSSKQVHKMSAIQQGILEQAAALVRAGGRMVYSTCTMYEAENETVVQDFLQRHDDWSLERIEINGLGQSAEFGLRISPLQYGTEPFFCALLHKSGSAPAVYDRIQRDAVEATIPACDELPTVMRLMQQGSYLLAVNEMLFALDLHSKVAALCWQSNNMTNGKLINGQHRH